MANRVSVSYKETNVSAITGSGRFVLGRVQRLDSSANIANTPVEELGSDKRVGRVFDLADVTASVSSIMVGPRNIFALAGLNFADQAEGTYVKADDICYTCLVQDFKQVCSSDVSPTLFIEGARVDRISFNASAGGDVTEEFSFQANDLRWLSYDVAVESGTLTGSMGNTFTFSGTPRQLSNGNYHLAVFVSDESCEGCQGKYVPDNGILTSTSTTMTFDPDIVPSGAMVTVVSHQDLTDKWGYTYTEPHPVSTYADTDMADQAVGIRGWGVEVSLVNYTADPSGVFTSSERMYRAQSASFQVAFPLTRVQELGSETYVGFTEGVPDVTGSFEIIQHDFELIKRLTDTLAGDNTSTSDYGETNWGLLFKIYRRGVDRSSTSPEATIWIPQIEMNQESNSANVGQDVRQTFNFSGKSGEVYYYKGNRPV